MLLFKYSVFLLNFVYISLHVFVHLFVLCVLVCIVWSLLLSYPGHQFSVVCKGHRRFAAQNARSLWQCLCFGNAGACDGALCSALLGGRSRVAWGCGSIWSPGLPRSFSFGAEFSSLRYRVSVGFTQLLEAGPKPGCGLLSQSPQGHCH